MSSLYQLTNTSWITNNYEWKNAALVCTFPGHINEFVPSQSSSLQHSLQSPSIPTVENETSHTGVKVEPLSPQPLDVTPATTAQPRNSDASGSWHANAESESEDYSIATQSGLNCDKCGKGFEKARHLRRHQHTHHSTVVSNTGDTSILHCRIQTGRSGDRIDNVFRPFQCTVCHQSFSELSQLQIHKKTHSGSKPYQCHICLKNFIRKSTLQIHLRIHRQSFNDE